MKNINNKNDNDKKNSRSIKKSRAPDAETAYIFNSQLFNNSTSKILFLVLGLYLSDKNPNKSTNYSMVLSIVPILYVLFGYNLTYSDVNKYFGIPSLWTPNDGETYGGESDATYSSGSDFIFQLVFAIVAVTISINSFSGPITDNITRAFVIFISVAIYCLTTSWSWGGGWLSEAGFLDFSGSSIVFVVGAVISIVFSFLLKPKLGEEPKIMKLTEKNDALTNILITIGMISFNGGSQLAKGSGADATAISNITVNTVLAGASSLLLGIFTGNFNSLPGLVAISAEPLAPSPILAIVVGVLGSIAYFLGSKLAPIINIDEPNSIGIFLAGIVGTFSVIFSNSDASFGAQLYGTGSLTIFVSVVSYILLYFFNLFRNNF